MSVQFGRWNFEGQPPAPDYIEKVGATLAPFGPDSNQSYAQGGVHILYRAFHTTKESHLETQPHISASGAAITWDGRLDNRAELISHLRDAVTRNSTDVAIASAAYEYWGAKCFAKLIGDWALSIWDPSTRSLVLAKDPIGTRPLYYSIEKDHITWGTVLDPLVLFASKTFALNEEYIAGWLSITFPAAHLTPYLGILAVPPSCSVLFRRGKHTVSKYWDFDPGKRIRYRTDGEYEEHFRNVFGMAVYRRLRSDRPVLAELSGGMDSSSIVCMADLVIARGAAEVPRLDTISWYDDSYDHIEPDSNELHWINKVEEKRGRTGCHINLASLTDTRVLLENQFEIDRFAATPITSGYPVEFCKQYAAYIQANKYRVTLSGIGGGEVMGDGVPSGTLEFQNLLSRGRLFALAYRLTAWALKMRKSLLPLLWEAVCGFLPPKLVGIPKDLGSDMRVAPWFHSGFVSRNQDALSAFVPRLKFFGPLPSFQRAVSLLNGDRRVLAHCPPRQHPITNARYPYFDRDFLEFMYAIPREQIVRVGHRRSLMRRALANIVPRVLLDRRRKAAVSQQSNSHTEPASLVHRMHEMVSSSLGFIDGGRFWNTLEKARRNHEIYIDSLMQQTLTFEFWLRHLTIYGIVTNPMSTERRLRSSVLGVEQFKTSARPKEFG